MPLMPSPAASARSLGSLAVSLVRGSVAALTCFGLANVLLGALGGQDRNHLWVNGQGAPGALLALALLAVAATRLAPGAFGRALRPVHAAGACAVATLCGVDGIAYEGLRDVGLVTGAPVSLSAVLAGVFALEALLGPPAAALGLAGKGLRLVTAGGCGGAVLLLHLMTFGASDYAHPADAAVVLGCKVHADGRPSDALRDRTRTACDLYHRGLVKHLVLSGGHGPEAPISEPEAMAAIARAAGVPEDALVLDPTGVTSEATLAEAGRLARQHGWRSLLLVSHDAHLARLSMLARVEGLDARTVPARETVVWRSKPLFVARELAAFAWHFVRTAG